MDKSIILAKAGAGKTFYICKDVKKSNRNLILAYTNQNIKNIKKELEDSNEGIIPDKTTIMTFHSFVYNMFIRPYELIYADHFEIPEYISQGVEVITEPEPQRIKGKHNNKYKNKDKIGHYYTKNMERIYVSRMSKLPILVNNKKNKLIEMVTSYLNKFFDRLYIDEAQDFREYDWGLLVKIIKGVNNILLVGDFYQHSVSGKNNYGKPFRKYNTYDKYIEYLRGLNLKVDQITLSDTRRCPTNVCDYVSKKTGVTLESHKECNNFGEVRVLNSVDSAIKVLEDESIVKLMWDKSKDFKFNAINWSYSKGDTYDSTCLVLTKELSKVFFDNDFSLSDGVTKNKLYVALTRTRGDLYIMSS